MLVRLRRLGVGDDGGFDGGVERRRRLRRLTVDGEPDGALAMGERSARTFGPRDAQGGEQTVEGVALVGWHVVRVGGSGTSRRAQMPGSGRRLRLPTAGPTHVLWRREALPRGAAAARGHVARRIGHLSVVERGLRRSAAARAWVLIAATWRGDGIASALACGHALLGSGGGSIDDSVGADLLRKRCAAGSSCVARPTAGSGFVRRRSRLRRRAWLALRGRESECFKAVLSRSCCGTTGLRTGLSELVLPWHATKSSVARREFANFTWYLLRYEKKIPFYRYHTYGISQRHIMALQVLRFPGSRAAYHRDLRQRISTQSDADNKYEISAIVDAPCPQPPRLRAPRRLLLLRISSPPEATARGPSRYLGRFSKLRFSVARCLLA